MFSDETSSQNENKDAGSMQNIWINLLLSWVNKCTEPEREVHELSGAGAALAGALGRYAGAPAAAPLLGASDLEPFLSHQFSLLRLQHLDVPRKMYIVSSVTLFYCVTRAGGAPRAAGALCARLPPRHQLLALLFCEKLGGMEVTLSNVEMAIKDACESVENYEANPDTTSISRILSDAPPGGILSDFSEQSDTTIALKSLRSSVIAVQASVIASGSSSYQASSASSGAGSSLLTKAEILSEPGEIIIPRKTNEDSKVSEADNDGATTGELYAEEKHVVAPNQALHVESETTVITDMAVNVQARKGGRVPYESVVSRPASPRHVSFKSASFKSPRFRNPFPSRMFAYFGERSRNIPYPGESKGGKWWKWLTLACCCTLMVLLCAVAGPLAYLSLSSGRSGAGDGAELAGGGGAGAASAPAVSAVDDNLDDAAELDTEPEDVPIREMSVENQKWLWECRNNVCQKVKGIESKPNFYSSSSRCTLLCLGPQIWPLPTEQLQHGKSLVALSSKHLQYTVNSAPSSKVQTYLVQAFGFFYKDVVKLENLGTKSSNRTLDLPLKAMNIRMSVEHDPEPRLKLATDEAYMIEIGADGNQLMVYLSGSSYCGVRHGLETLSQMLMSDQSTGYLISLNSAVVKDSPNHPYRGLMLETARNYIPIPDIIRTIDAMASVKLNTFHWRITDATSFPLLLPEFSDLFEHGAYDRSMVYTKEDVMYIAERAGVRGVRVLVELALPGPVGRAWSWSRDASCPSTDMEAAGSARSCRNQLCLRLNVTESLFDVLQYLYTEILEMTAVDDIFHLSNGLFSLTNCHFLLEDRKGFLPKALETLKLANRGVLPALPVVWYTSQVGQERARSRLGAQLHRWREGLTERRLAGFHLIQSTKWDLSCEMKNQRCYKYRTWQEMYEWRSWKAIDALNIEGGEGILWTDLVNSGNLDMHVWPRAAAVAERLWADEALGAGAALSAPVYVRMDHHITRMSLRGVAVPPLWPRWCRTDPRACLSTLRRD